MSNEYNNWLGKTLITEDEIGLTLVRRAAAMANLDPSMFEHGSALPPHWYSIFFTPNAQASQIGHDGHPEKGDFLPPIALPRRMFVGREVNFIRSLRVGELARKVSEITSITPKRGSSGQLVFVQVKHTIEVAGNAALIEWQNIVYREPIEQPTAKISAGAASVTKQMPAHDWSVSRTIEPIDLFRYSALTWNGHRIHYDADYARNTEGYPECVMNGALTVHWLLDEALLRAAGATLLHLKAKLSSPLFLGDHVQLLGSALSPQDGVNIMQVVAFNPQGKLSASVELHFQPTH